MEHEVLCVTRCQLCGCPLKVETLTAHSEGIYSIDTSLECSEIRRRIGNQVIISRVCDKCAREFTPNEN
nr:MAG TPA: hypothetical protein [Caudoviricetes sp.]